MLGAALGYAARGWPVHPLAGKRATVKAWPTQASTDPAVVRAWWTERPSANIGVVTGPRSGLAVVDVDPRSGGAESLAALRERVELPPTLTARTGGGGLHLVYAHPGCALAGRTHALGRGIDAKADGGYIVAAPSVHPDTGARYVWANPGTEVAPWPVALDALMGQTRVGAQPTPRPGDIGATVAVSALAAWVSRQAEGGRNSALFWAACRAAESGVGNLAPLVRAGMRAGLDEHEAAATVASAERRVGGVA